MVKSCIWGLCLVWVLFGCSYLSADTGKGFRFVQNYTLDDYKANSQNWWIDRDRRGVYYFANSEKVLEFDGVSWRGYHVSNGSIVRSVLVGSDGEVYVGAVGELGYLRSSATGGRSYQSLLDRIPEPHRVFGDVWHIYETKDGVYFFTSTCIYRWKNAQMATVTTGNRFHWAFKIGDRLYVNERGSGLKELRGDVLEPVAGGGACSEKRLYALFQIDADRMLGVTREDGLIILSPAGMNVLKSAASSFLRDAQVYRGIVLHDGRWAISTIQKGLVILNSRMEIDEILDRSTGLQSSLVYYAYAAPEGGLWLALNSGISRVELPSPFTVYDERVGLEESVKSVRRHKGQLYVATLGGVYVLKRGAGSAGLARAQIIGNCGATWELAEVEGELLTASQEGIFRIEGERAERLMPGISLALLQSNRVAGRLYRGTVEGLEALDYAGGKLTSAGKVGGLKSEVRSIAEQGSDIWVGTLIDGIYRVAEDGTWTHYTTENGLPKMRDNNVSLLGDKIYISTFTGLMRPDGDRLVQATEFNATNGREVYGLVEDATGNLWIEASPPALALKKARGYQMVDVPFKDLPDGYTGCVYPDIDGLVWIGGDRGLFSYNSAERKQYGVAFQVLIRRVQAGRARAVYEGVGTVTEALIEAAEGRIRFEFAATSYHKGMPNSYKYRLEGLDEEWSDWTGESFKEYTNLSAGNYRLLLRARNLYGVEAAEAVFAFKVLPAWYETWWARLLYLAGAAMLLHGALKWRTSFLIRRNAQLELAVLRRTQEVVSKNEEIERKNAALLDSLSYAERIQRAILPSLNAALILFRPRDIVSGDFYWYRETAEATYLVVADCTGHGVPGALMSMIGNILLKQIVMERAVSDPAEILRQLDLEVRNALRQNEADSETMDGMDLGVCRIEARQLTYAGARLPLYVVTDDGLLEIEGARFSVGGRHRHAPQVESRVILRERPMTIYMVTDGLADQPNASRQRFSSRRLKRLLVEVSTLEFKQQLQCLEHELELHQGNEEQRDDITLVGVRLESAQTG